MGTYQPESSEQQNISDNSAYNEKAQEEGVFVYAPSFAQQRLWFLNQLDPDSSAYNLSLTFRVVGRLEPELLEKALNAIVRRHETLRTTFELVNGELAQVIAPELTISMSITDLQALPADRREADAEWLLTDEVRRPFDLRTGPVFRAHLWRLAPDQHILMLNMHHIVGDGWSFGILRNEMGALYEAYRSGQSPALPELPIQYADFACWQRDWLQSEMLAQQCRYWKEALDAPSPLLNMPTDHPRPSVRTSQGAVQRILLPPAVSAGIRALSEREGCTTYMTYLAAYKVLLYRFAGQTDLWVGSPVAGRTQPEIESLIGCFINTLILRTDLSGNPTFRDFLHQVRDVSIGALAHQEMPFELLVDKLEVERDRSRNPLFQAMFIDSSTFIQPLELPELKFVPLLIERGGSMVDLTLFLVGSDEGLKVGLEYSTDLFTHETATRLLQTYVTLLASIVSEPAQSLESLPLLTAGERRQLLVRNNDTNADYPKEQTACQLLEAQAERTPDATAITCNGQTLTYRQLHQRANQIAYLLRAKGVGPETLVGLRLPRSPEMVVAALAIWKAGGAYVPLDPAYPAERLQFMCDNARLRLVLTQSDVSASLALSAEMLCLDKEQPILQAQPTHNLTPTATPDNLAYVLYTSGSTGKPKGVQIPHRPLVNFLCAMQQQPGLSETDTLAAVTTLSFDIAGLELWLPLLTGAKVVLVDEETRTDGHRLAALLTAEQVTVMQATPATWRLLLASGWTGKSDLKLLCGGEALPSELAEALLTRCGSLWNMYGPTETTIWSLVSEVRAGEDITLGRPIANTRVYVLDAHGEPVALGVPGELYLGGEGLARGYLGLPELTAERFVVDGFSEVAGARLYRTGDLVRYRSEGGLEFLGRLDHQVKVRGFRIELREIEAALIQHPSVTNGVVVARQDEAGETLLAAYVVPAVGLTLDPAPLRAHLQRLLPHYMIPNVFVALEALPLNGSGKVDRQALPAPVATGRSEPKASVSAASEDPLHLQLQQLWERILNVRPIGIQDNFFDLGGHSLIAVQLFAAIEKSFGKRLPLSLLFQAPTIQQLAIHLRQPEKTVPWSTIVSIQSNGTRPPFFCVHAVGANVLNYHLLSRYLGEDQPFYGFQAQGLDGKQAPFATVEEMAAQYIREMRQVQPNGPYYLGGGSSGGTVAFEMAQQLTAQGEEVALVALIDTLLMRHQVMSHSRSASALRQQARLLDLHLGHMLQMSFQDQMRYLSSAAYHKTVLKMRQITGRTNVRQGVLSERSFAQLRKTILAAIRRYQPTPYAGKLVLFVAVESPYRTHNDPRLQWGEFAQGGLELHLIPGDHDSILDEPNVITLAAQLRTRIRP